MAHGGVVKMPSEPEPKIWRDLSSPAVIHTKGWLFLVIAVLASLVLILQIPTLQTVILEGVALWASCRWYYYMFYVIEKYVDSDFKFAGLTSVIKYLLRKRA